LAGASGKLADGLGPWSTGAIRNPAFVFSVETGGSPSFPGDPVTLKRKMEPLKSRKGTKNQGFAVNDILTSRVSESISPTLLFLVIFGAFRGFHFGI